MDQGDSIGNSVTITGKVVSTGKTISDTSSASITLPTNIITKTVYAVNGIKVTGAVTIQAGDLVTYDLTMTTPLTSTHRVSLTDFLPLPTFQATDPAANGGNGGFTFLNVTSATPPALGIAEFGPADTFHPAVPGTVPTITANATANSLTFDFGDYTKGTTQYPTNVADILYTIRAGDQAFADGLLLTNQVTESETNSFGAVAKQNAIVQVKLGEPVLKIEKAVVATSNAAATFSGNRGPDSYLAPGSAGTRFSGGVISGAALAAKPLGDSLSGIVAGDAVSFAVVVENTGSGPNGAFDLVLHDTIPTGFNAPTNLRVTDGAGNVLAYTNVGAGLFDPAGGIHLTDNGAKGSLAAYDATTGKNVVVITYDATASVNVPVPNYDLHNVATITGYAAEQGGINHASVTPAANLTASSDVFTAKPLFAKAVIATSDPAPTPGGNNIHSLAIGAIATYDITLTLTKGTAGNVVISDLLPSGAGGQLDLVSATVKSIGADITGSTLTVGASANGGAGVFNFGTLTDGFNTQGAADRIVVEVLARATNIAVNKGGQNVTNTATLSETDPNNPRRRALHANRVRDRVAGRTRAEAGQDRQLAHGTGQRHRHVHAQPDQRQRLSQRRRLRRGDFRHPGATGAIRGVPVRLRPDPVQFHRRGHDRYGQQRRRQFRPGQCRRDRSRQGGQRHLPGQADPHRARQRGDQQHRDRHRRHLDGIQPRRAGRVHQR